MKSRFRELEEQVREDLIAWYNVVPDHLRNEDLDLLADLYLKGRFEAWDCPLCGERCYSGCPDDWDHFQGVCNIDHVSYPALEDGIFKDAFTLILCDSCRCYRQPSLTGMYQNRKAYLTHT